MLVKLFSLSLWEKDIKDGNMEIHFSSFSIKFLLMNPIYIGLKKWGYKISHIGRFALSLK